MNQNQTLLRGRTERSRGEWGLARRKLHGLGKKNQSLWWIVQGLLGLELKWCGGLGKAARGTSPSAALHCGICRSLCYANPPREFLSYSVCHVFTFHRITVEKANAVKQTREWHLLMSHHGYYSQQEWAGPEWAGGGAQRRPQIGHAAVKVIWTTKINSWPFQIHYLHLYTSSVYGAHAKETEEKKE